MLEMRADTIDLKHQLEQRGFTIPVMDLYGGSPDLKLGVTSFDGVGLVHELHNGTVGFLKIPKMLVLLSPAMEPYIKEFFPHLNYVVAPYPIFAKAPHLLYNVGSRFTDLSIGGVDVPTYNKVVAEGYWRPTYTRIVARRETLASAQHAIGVNKRPEATQSAANRHSSHQRWARDVSQAYGALGASPESAVDDKDYTVVRDSLGEPDYIFIVNYRNQEGKIKRCLDSIKAQVPPPGKTFGILICDDVSTDNSVEVVENWISSNQDIQVNYRVNNSRAYSALNVYRAIHNFAQGYDPIYIEVDGDDYLAGRSVLRVLKEYYTCPTTKRTLGSFTCLPDPKPDMTNRVAASRDYSNPYHLGKAAGWAPLRTVRASLARRVEPMYYQDRITGTWLTKCDDSSIGARLIELAGSAGVVFITAVMYVYDNSGVAHDHDDTWTPLWSHQHLYPAVTF